MNYDLNFDWQTYLNNYDDLRKAGINTKEAALQHWLTYGKNEGRIDTNIKICIFFHIGDIKIFYDIYNRYNVFFKRTSILLYITVHNEHDFNIIKNIYNNAIITIIDNKGIDIGGFLINIKNILNQPVFDEIKYFYIIHTKTNEICRNKLLDSILLNYNYNEKKYINEKKPIIICSEYYLYNNIKGNNIEKIKLFFDRYKTLFKTNYDLNSIEDFFFKYNNEFYNEEKNSIIFNDKFYKYIESDLERCAF
jgi:hypothetical protein